MLLLNTGTAPAVCLMANHSAPGLARPQLEITFVVQRWCKCGGTRAGGVGGYAMPLTRLEDLSEDDYEDPADDPELIELKT